MRLQNGFAEDTIVSSTKGEVRVIVCCGKVELEEEKPGQYKVISNIDGFKYPPSGRFFSKGKEDILKILESANDNGYDMILRFEKVRKKGVDNNIPIEQLVADMGTAKENIFKTFTGIYNIKEDKWIAFGEVDPSNDTDMLNNVVKGAISGSRESITEDSFFGGGESNQEEVNTRVTNYVEDKGRDRRTYLAKAFLFVKKCEDKYGFSLKDNEARIKIADELVGIIDNAYKFISGDAGNINYNSYKYEELCEFLIKYEELVDNLNKERLANFKDWRNEFAKLIGSLNK